MSDPEIPGLSPVLTGLKGFESFRMHPLGDREVFAMSFRFQKKVKSLRLLSQGLCVSIFETQSTL